MRNAFESFGGHRKIRTGENPTTTSFIEFYRFMCEWYADFPRSILYHIFANILRTNAKFTKSDFDTHDISMKIYSKGLTDTAWGRK
jgi:hypothetical protein